MELPFEVVWGGVAKTTITPSLGPAHASVPVWIENGCNGTVCADVLVVV